MMVTKGYCVKCKKMVEMKSPVESKTKKGTKIAKGKCPDCGITVCRMGGMKNKAVNKIIERRKKNESSEIICIREINDNIRRIFNNKKLTRPLRVLNSNCQFRERYELAFNLRNNVKKCRNCHKEFQCINKESYCSRECKKKYEKNHPKRELLTDKEKKQRQRESVKKYGQKPGVKQRRKEYYQKKVQKKIKLIQVQKEVRKNVRMVKELATKKNRKKLR